jgi:hypothetical protein
LLGLTFLVISLMSSQPRLEKKIIGFPGVFMGLKGDIGNYDLGLNENEMYCTFQTIPNDHGKK